METRDSKRSTFIGIAGGTGSGKTTVTRILRERFSHAGIAVIDQDSYYVDRGHLPEAERDNANFDEPAAIDHDLLFEHMRRLLSSEAIDKPRYSYLTHRRLGESDRVVPAPFVIVEGLYALWDPRLRDLMDLKIYVAAHADLRVIRRMERDLRERGRTPDSVIRQYLVSVRPMHEQHIEPTRAFADLVIENVGDLGELTAALDRAVQNLSLRHRAGG